jgi:hypothetical protein
MSRLRLAILLALTAIVALPTSAHARRIAQCHLFSPESVGKAVNYRGITVRGQVTAAPSLTHAPGRMSICDFSSGRDQVAESTIMTLRTSSKAAAEFKMLLRTREAAHPRRVNGPWKSAYQVANKEMFMLKGRYIFFIGYQVSTTKATGRGLVGLAKRAAKNL